MPFETNERLRLVVDSLPALISYVDRDHCYRFVNSAYERWFGRLRSEVEGRHVREVLGDAAYQAVLPYIRRVLAGETLSYETVLPYRSGGTRYIHATYVPHGSGDGQVRGYVSLVEDITARKQAEAELRESEERLRLSEERFRAALRSAPIGVFNQDLELRYTWVHDTGLRLTARGDVLGRTDAELWERSDEAEAVRALKQGVLHTGSPARREMVLHVDGVRRVYDLTVEPLRDAQGGVLGLTGVLVDITERRQIEERLRQSSKMEAIGRLAGGLAHDFNNQLHALSGFAEFVGRDTGLGPRARQDLLEIQRIADRMARLTRQLLAFSRQQILMPETLELGTAVREAEALLQRLIGRSVEMTLHPSPSPVWVRVDRAQLLQVLMNLAINGRDAMPDGGTLSIRTGRRDVGPGELDEEPGGPVPAGRYASVTVSDSGTGIAPEYLPHIFEPFFTTKAVGQGTGLGLATVHGIVTQSQGHILVRTVRERGTTFEVLLPEVEQPPARQSGEYPASGRSDGSASILVVEDEEIVRAIVARTLEEAGFRVLQARHGGEALEWLHRLDDRIDLIVSDVVMPVMGGRELARRLAETKVPVPVIWMSGYPRDDSPGIAGPLDGSFLQKPVLGDVLVDTVRRVLGARQEG